MNTDAELELPAIRRDASRARTSDLVFDELMAAIRDLRLAPGRELSESALTSRFGVSRTPVREALARLVSAGLVHVIPQVGTQVARISAAGVLESQFVREHLELGAFEAACARDGVTTDRLEYLLDEQNTAFQAGDDEMFFASDEQLHRTIFELAGFPGAWEVCQSSKVDLDRLRRLTLPERDTTRDLIAEHTAIVDALRDGRASDGRDTICVHLRRAAAELPRLRREHPHYFQA
ncbi:GntR family transcriptional regulator [Rhodococcoides trifolii]|uniref:GntR family transcriptional regulator n=1 Tax=Rhodococcoides trifolii TaxID=908250 RepID=A0A917CUF7_9NOCA|nr:GntR family transcriptional regulator [Rhodococcus trifolii]GGF99991.1 GntR family transcriptional regulator [Rhodococcus trifolii]